MVGTSRQDEKQVSVLSKKAHNQPEGSCRTSAESATTIITATTTTSGREAIQERKQENLSAMATITMPTQSPHSSGAHSGSRTHLNKHHGYSSASAQHQGNKQNCSSKYPHFQATTDSNNNNNHTSYHGKPFLSHYSSQRRTHNNNWNNSTKRRFNHQQQQHTQPPPPLSLVPAGPPPPIIPLSGGAKGKVISVEIQLQQPPPNSCDNLQLVKDHHKQIHIGSDIAISIDKKIVENNEKPEIVPVISLNTSTRTSPEVDKDQGHIKRVSETGQLLASKQDSPKSTIPPATNVNERSSGEPERVLQDAAAAPPPQPPTQYPYELLKIIRDNMNSKDNTNLWALLNNIAGPLIIKNVNTPFGIPPPPINHDGGDISTAAGQRESALLHAMEQNFIQNHPGYELLANAIFSNGGLLPNYFADPLLSTFPPPPGVPVSQKNNTTSDKSAAEAGNRKTPPTVGSPVHNSGFPQQQQQHQNMHQYRMPPSGDGIDSGGSGNGNVYGNGHNSGRHPSVYSPPFNNNGNSEFVYNSQYNPNTPFFYNGHMFYPRPKNFWNFCLNCKKSQYCQLHNNNYNSSASAFYTNAAYGNCWQHHYIAVPNNYYSPDYYPYHHQHHYHNRSYNNSYYNHHHQHTYNHHGGSGGGGYRDKRSNRRIYQKQPGNRSDVSAPSSPSGSCPTSPKTVISSPVGHVAATAAAVEVQPQKDNAATVTTNKNNKNDQRRNGGDRKASANGGKFEINNKSNNNQMGKKRWQGTGQQHQRGGNEYDSDTSSSRSNGSESNYVLKCNYGLLQNMKLWNTESTYKKEQLLAGELGSQQLMSPTNHKNNNPGPFLMTIVEAQGACGGGVSGGADGVGYTGDLHGLTATQPVIQHEEQPGSESAYWSSIFPFNGGLDEGVGGVEESTPADKYLANAHLMEVLDTPKELIEGMSRDTLSQQIWNTFLTVQQTQTTYKKKLVIWKLLYASIKKVFPHLSVYLVGSTITGFGAETSDVDMCVVSSAEFNLEPRLEAVINLTELKKFLSVSEAFERFHLIQAKVPILRFRDSLNQIEVDLNYNNSVGIRNTHLLYCYSNLDWRVRPLVSVVKLWAKYQDINNAKNMTISSYSLALMVIHFLQCGVSPSVLPCLHTIYPGKFGDTADVSDIDMNEELDAHRSLNKQTLGELFLQFLFYYSNFDYNNLAISVRTGSCLYIEDCRYVRSAKNDPQQWKNLCIEEPFDYTNTARSVYDVEVFQKIQYVFVQSYQQLQQTLDLKSILKEKFISFPVSHCGGGGYHQRDPNNPCGEL